ncbi:related to ankyrins [Cephalotrichum gorgonifer]|uniref:Related to ankyrins n=1 Tax=Cephalotrichum gorgonifer TaxID=2041049 RepID=A0AAE8N272_9PEZI|nr:related to ankyrins [Cephalotrichum gorgonifer]
MANPFLLAADNSPDLLPLLRADPSLASSQDHHGYSLVHAAASYNHLDLLRLLVTEFNVPVDLRDEDDETALFVVETVDAARTLVEELGADINARGKEGYTAREKIESEDDYPEVAAYLKTKEPAGQEDATNGQPNGAGGEEQESLPPLPEGMSLRVGTMDAEADVPEEADPELRRRIMELAERDDFHSPAGQEELRRLVEDAIMGQDIAEDRQVRPKLE